MVWWGGDGVGEGRKMMPRLRVSGGRVQVEIWMATPFSLLPEHDRSTSKPTGGWEGVAQGVIEASIAEEKERSCSQALSQPHRPGNPSV